MTPAAAAHATRPRPTVVVRTDRERALPALDADLRALGADLRLLPTGVDPLTLARALHDADLLVVCHARVTADVLDAAPRLRAIVKCGVGVDAIDLAAARRRGIAVRHVPDYATDTVAEAAVLLMLALLRRLRPVRRAMDAHGWLWPEPRWLGNDAAGRTLGVVGLGRIGRAVARLAAAFRMTVIASHPGLDPARVPEGVALCASLDALLERADIVSIHCALTDRTRHLLGVAELARMKPGALLVNVARGAIVDEAALVAALAAGHLGGVALDVFEREPLPHRGHPLVDLAATDDRVLLTPHLAFHTHEAVQRLQRQAFELCVDALAADGPAA